MGEDKDRSRERSRRDRPSRFSERSRDRSTDRGRRGGKASGCRVYVSNIPYEYSWQDLKDLFRSEVGEVQFVELFVDENEKPRGCGIVEFADQQSVRKCMEVMQRYEVKGRQLVIKDDSGAIRDKTGRIVGGGGKRPRDDSMMNDRGFGGSLPSLASLEGKWGNTYGLSASFLESLNIDVPLCNRVFVANLDYKVDKKKLKEIFRLGGKVQRVDLHTDKDGNSRGFAIVEYDHPVEAVQAISMFHNQLLYDRMMTVRMDRAQDHARLPEGLKGIGMGLGASGEPLKDVSHNLPALNNNVSGQSNGAPGILGALPSSALQVANALSGLNTSQGLGNIATNPSVLQAATLSNLLGNGLTGGDLNSLVSNTLGQNSSGVGNAGNIPSFNRDSQPTSFGGNQSFGSSRGFESFDSGKGGFGNDRDNSFGNRNANAVGGANQGGGRFSNKVLITNLPPTATFKMVREKLGEFGDVQHIEEKANGGMVVVYTSYWQAERAIKNLDRARIDGRTIEARPYY